MTDVELQTIEDRCKAAKPGHWDSEGYEEFIANARADVSALVAEVRRLRVELAEIKATPTFAPTSLGAAPDLRQDAPAHSVDSDPGTNEKGQ